MEGQDVVFNCLVEGNPKPSVRWTKNEEGLNLAAKTRLSPAIINNTYTLTITDVHLTDAGQYRTKPTTSQVSRRFDLHETTYVVPLS